MATPTPPPPPPSAAAPPPAGPSSASTSFATATATTTTRTSTPNIAAAAAAAAASDSNNNNNNNLNPTITTTTTTGGSGFAYPREWHFPPFFTPQPNLSTRAAQLAKWGALVQAWCASRRQFRLSLSSPPPTTTSATPNTTTITTTSSSDAPAADDYYYSFSNSDRSRNRNARADANEAAAAAADSLFHNRRIGRRLAPAAAREVLETMRREGRAERVGGGGGGSSSSSNLWGGGGDDDGGGGDVYLVYWRTPEEWAALVEAWVEDTAHKGVVLTLYELTEGEDTRGAEFHGLDPEILQKALQTLVRRGKAQVFGQEDQQGVKFF
ncbi:ESCRT-II complex subunit-domain-containing protein [Xylariaceae sp. FL0804]|nr:ESCRT-II complex subunit-domain-containing protein [Xylariaceae sp. FL0804]